MNSILPNLISEGFVNVINGGFMEIRKYYIDIFFFNGENIILIVICYGEK